MRNLRLLVACTAIFSLLFAVSCSDDDGAIETNCTDGLDNDGDGPIDCNDSDCAGNQACQTVCNNNNLCEPALGENETNCPADCSTAAVCGNGTCELGENETNCPDDCATTPYCGDGTCDANEDATSCPADCASGDQCVATTDLIEQNGCPGQSCSLTDAAGTIGCMASGTNADYADCSNGSGCLAGSICAGDGTTSNCMPFCDLNDPAFVCPGGGTCMFQITTGGGPVGLCGEGDTCDPFAMTGCGTGEACYFVNGATICATEGTIAAGASCQYVEDCVAGLLCDGTTCLELCDAAFTCVTGTCQGIGTFADFPDYGVCQ